MEWGIPPQNLTNSFRVPSKIFLDGSGQRGKNLQVWAIDETMSDSSLRMRPLLQWKLFMSWLRQHLKLRQEFGIYDAVDLTAFLGWLTALMYLHSWRTLGSAS